MKFNSGEQLLKYIKGKSDLYDVDSEQYVFLYNDYGAIAVYRIDLDEFMKLYKRAERDDEYIGAYLGYGGYIYDSVDNPNKYDAEETERYSSLDWCNDNYKGRWIET